MAKLDQININGTTYEMVPEIAPLFDATKAYAIGDCVIKDAVLYRFTVAHAAGAWTGTDAEEIVVGKELTDLKADLGSMRTATAEDVNKALLVKTVTDGKVTEWKFGETDKTLTTDVDYDNSDVVTYVSSTPTNHNQYCVVISPDTTSDYYIKSAKVRAFG